jgi:hypothetical protein
LQFISHLVLNSNQETKRNQSNKINCMKTGIFTLKTIGNKTALQRLAAIFTAAFLLLASTGLQAQDVLMGLTSNGGPEGKGTAYSIKTDTKAYNVIRKLCGLGLPAGERTGARHRWLPVRHDAGRRHI